MGDTGMQVFMCGGDRCPKDGQPHQWDGPMQTTELSESSTCSQCGLAYIDWCLLNADG